MAVQPDFTNKQAFPMEAYIEGARRPGRYEGLSNIINSGMSGITKGMELGKEIQSIREKKAKRLAAAELIKKIQSDPDIQESIGLLTEISKYDPDKAIGLYSDYKIAKLKPAPAGITFITPEQANAAAASGQPQKPGTKIIPREPKTLGQIEAESAARTKGTEGVKQEKNRESLAASIDEFLAIDESIPRGVGLGRFAEGAITKLEEIGQETERGQAAAAHDAVSKRLRVQLVRASGDVGNINIIEQEAAEKIIPNKFDSQKVTEVKRELLIQLSKAIKERDAAGIKEILKTAGVSYKDKSEKKITTKQPKNKSRFVIEGVE